MKKSAAQIWGAWRRRKVCWVRSYEDAETLSTYNSSSERAAYSELTSSHVAKIEVREVEGVVGDLPVANA